MGRDGKTPCVILRGESSVSKAGKGNAHYPNKYTSGKTASPIFRRLGTFALGNDASHIKRERMHVFHMLLCLLIPLVALVLRARADEYNRPAIHLTPTHGWMNDPNGLFYDKTAELWHAYYQYNPNDTIWDLPLYWGHSTSKDLIHWEQQSVALGPENDDEGIYSGSIVVDYNNTSGFFDDSIDHNQRVVAIYTNNLPDVETQDIAYSLDGGYTFTKYENNPVLDVSLTQFRDPKVFWHAPSQQWIMVVAKTQEYKIQIYGLPDLRSWALHSNFTLGYYGMQYECPGLIEIPVENSSDTRWVLFIAINPGSPLGGSINQYFIGDFNGYEFQADDTATRFMDIGKDFYAFQTFSDVPSEFGVLGLAWASNWQYANKVPTDPWRSSMTLVRNYSLAEVAQNTETKVMTLKQQPVLPIEPQQTLDESNCNGTALVLEAQGQQPVFEFELEFTVTTSFAKNAEANLEVVLGTQQNETVTIGFDPVGEAFYMDRSTDHPFNEHPLFTDKLSTYVHPIRYDEDEWPVYHIHGIIDTNIAEIFFGNGASAMTNTFFLSADNRASLISVVANTEGFFINEATLKEY